MIRNARPFGRTDWLLLIAVLLLASVFRLYRLDSAPPGLWRDEAGYALAAQDILRGDFRVYWGDKEPFFPYLLASVFSILGATPLVLRTTAAVCGILTVGATFLLGRQLMGRTAGALAAAGLATVFWHVDLSRVGFRVSTMPLVITMAFYFLWRAIETNDGEPGATASQVQRGPSPVGSEVEPGRQWKGEEKTGRGATRDALIAGALLGLAPYTYLAARMAPIVALGLFGWLLLIDRGRVAIRQWIVIFTVSLVVFLPLGVFYLREPSYFLDRASQLSPFGAASGPLDVLGIAGRGMLDTAGMFWFRGDSEPRHNLPGRPALDPISGSLFTIGFAVSLWRSRQAQYAFLLLWLLLLLVPSALAVDNPHFLRTLGAVPAVFLIAAAGAETVWAGLRRLLAWQAQGEGGIGVALRETPPSQATWLGWTLAISGVGISSALTAHDYFVTWANSPQVAAFFEADVAAAARLLAAAPEPLSFASAPFSPHPTTEFLAPGRVAPIWFDGGEGLVVPAGRIPAGGAVYALTGSNDRARELLKKVYPSGVLRQGDLGSDGRPLAWAFAVPGDSSSAIPAPTRPLVASISDLADIVGIDPPSPVVSQGEIVTVAVHWIVRDETTRPDIAWFVHLLDSSGLAHGQHDAVAYPSSEWRGGERVISWFDVPVAPSAGPGRYRLILGAYPRSTLRRIPVTAAGVTSDELQLATVKVPLPANSIVPGQRLDVGFDHRIRLVGMDRPERCVPGSPCKLTLYWQANETPGEDLTVFVHLAGNNGRPIAQADSQPRDGGYPTSIWSAGEVVPDIHTFPVGVPPGNYRLLAGLYRLIDGRRLPLDSGGDFADLGVLPIGE